jgi:hypothetical protein
MMQGAYKRPLAKTKNEKHGYYFAMVALMPK